MSTEEDSSDGIDEEISSEDSSDGTEGEDLSDDEDDYLEKKVDTIEALVDAMIEIENAPSIVVENKRLLSIDFGQLLGVENVFFSIVKLLVEKNPTENIIPKVNTISKAEHFETIDDECRLKKIEYCSKTLVESLDPNILKACRKEFAESEGIVVAHADNRWRPTFKRVFSIECGHHDGAMRWSIFAIPKRYSFVNLRYAGSNEPLSLLKIYHSAPLTRIECCVCLETIETRVSLACKHAVCDACMSRWREVAKTCPLCRQPMVKTVCWKDFNTLMKQRNPSEEILLTDELLTNIQRFCPEVSTKATLKRGSGKNSSATLDFVCATEDQLEYALNLIKTTIRIKETKLYLF
jgi:hypothetical protein